MIGLAASLAELLGAFFPWFSGYSALEISTWTALVPEYFVYQLPLVAGFTSLVGSCVALAHDRLSKPGFFLTVCGTVLMLVFVADFLRLEFVYLEAAQFGFFTTFSGLLVALVYQFAYLAIQARKSPSEVER